LIYLLSTIFGILSIFSFAPFGLYSSYIYRIYCFSLYDIII